MTSFLILLGTTRLYLFSDFVLIYDLTVGRIFNPKPLVHPNRWFIGLVVILAASSMLSPVTLAQSWQTVLRLVMLAYLLINYRVRFGRMSKLFLVVMLGVAIWQLMNVESRAHGHSMNQTVFGMFGMALVFYAGWPVALLGSGILATSIARIPLAMLWVYAIFDRRFKSWLLACFATIIFVWVGLEYTPQRLNVVGFIDSFEGRVAMMLTPATSNNEPTPVPPTATVPPTVEVLVATVIPTTVETATKAVTVWVDKIENRSEKTLKYQYLDDRCGERRPVELKWYGYGFGGYCQNTGTPTPHNVYILSLYELGVLVVPFWICLFMLVRKVAWRVWLPLAVMAGFTDDLYSIPEGIYVVAIWLVSVGVFHTISTRPVRRIRRSGWYSSW